MEQFMVARWDDAVGHVHWGWDLWWRRGGWRVADPPNSPQHLIWADAVASLPQPPDTVFTVVRDPVARLASEHRWQRRARRGTWAGKILAWLPFSFWLRVMLATARHHPHAFDNHLRPQIDFVPEGACIFRLEDGLAPVANWLAKTLGETLPEAVFPHAIPTGAGLEISPADQALIGTVFAADYLRFGYTPPTPGPTGTLWVDRLATVLAPLIIWADQRGKL